MMNLMKKITGKGGKETEATSTPAIIRRRELDDRPAAEKYAMQPGRAYRKFPAEAPESAIQEPCGSCGHGYDGPTQTHCPSCNTDRQAYMLDVTDQPFHALPVEVGKPIEIPAEAMIPTIGGPNIQLGREAKSFREQGDRVIIGSNSSVKLIAGNHVEIGPQSCVQSVVGRDQVIIYHGVTCEDGVTAKEISIGDDCHLGRIVVPENGRLSIGNGSTVGIIWMGRGSCLIGSPHNLKASYLVALDRDCAIFLGHDCEIKTIESNEPIRISTGERYQNINRQRLSKEYNLIALIDKVVRESLGGKT